MSMTPLDPPAIVECPRCGSPGRDTLGLMSCPQHGDVVPLRLVRRTNYASLVATLESVADFPLLRPTRTALWSLAQIGTVRRAAGESVSACVTSWVARDQFTESGQSVRLDLVAEEPGVGLGARVAGLPGVDAGGAEREQPLGRFTISRAQVPMWCAAHAHDGRSTPLDRFALFGEYGGRWCWIVVWPAAEALGLLSDLTLDELEPLGPQLVEVSFQAAARSW